MRPTTTSISPSCRLPTSDSSPVVTYLRGKWRSRWPTVRRRNPVTTASTVFFLASPSTVWTGESTVITAGLLFAGWAGYSTASSSG